MRNRFTATLIVIWWIATPTVCGAFRSVASCEPSILTTALERPDPVEMPCHGDAPLPTSAPAGNEGDEDCCSSIELAASAKSEVGAQMGLPPLAFSVTASFPSVPAAHLPTDVLVDELRSPYRQTSPPLLN